MKLIEKYEPNVVKAAWNIFGQSYRYREEYNKFKAIKQAEAREITGQLSFFKE